MLNRHPVENRINILVRQPLTQSSEQEASIVRECLREIEQIDGHFARFNFLGGTAAQSNASFRENFEKQIGAPFNPRNFRRYRLSLMRNADAFINIRTAMSESTVFEIAFNIFAGENIPMLFAVWRHSPIKTTLIRDLQDLGDVTYVEFDRPRDLRRPLWQFLERIAEQPRGDATSARPACSQLPSVEAGPSAVEEPESDHTAVLALADGTIFRGYGVGAEGLAVGELCFNTAMTGYQEVLSDPSYAGQIVTFSFPHVGNVGVNEEDREAALPLARGCVLRDGITAPSNHRSTNDLSTWLGGSGLIGISGVDTRELTMHLRDKGVQNCAIAHRGDGRFDIQALVSRAADAPSLVGQDLAEIATTKNPVEAETRMNMNSSSNLHVVVIDYGVKSNIVECLQRRGCRVTVVPATASAKDVLKYEPDGILLSNGPGDPVAVAPYTVPTIRSLSEQGLPIFGICLGHQLLALALGAKIAKMHFGHHGVNHPVYDKEQQQVLITSQNHGFVVDRDSLPTDAAVTHVSLFDGTLAGFEVPKKQILSVQFHPEASPGPHDASYLFDDFVATMRGERATPLQDSSATAISSQQHYSAE